MFYYHLKTALQTFFLIHFNQFYISSLIMPPQLFASIKNLIKNKLQILSNKNLSIKNNITRIPDLSFFKDELQKTSKKVRNITIKMGAKHVFEPKFK